MFSWCVVLVELSDAGLRDIFGLRMNIIYIIGEAAVICIITQHDSYLDHLKQCFFSPSALSINIYILKLSKV